MAISHKDIHHLADVLNESIEKGELVTLWPYYYLLNEKRGGTIYWTLRLVTGGDHDNAIDISQDVTMKTRDMHYYLHGILTAVNGHLKHGFSSLSVSRSRTPNPY